MGEATQRKLWVRRVRAGLDVCIYCGDPSAEIEHMPPRALFLRKDRPTGMEFASCSACNRGTAWVDQLAAFIARMQLSDLTPLEQKEWRDALRAVENNHPGLIRDMQVNRAAEKLALSRIGIPHTHGVVAVPPLVHQAMLLFTAKLGFAVHQITRGERVPDEGGVLAIWLSNQQTLSGVSFDQIDHLLGELRYIKQGRKTSAGQFVYKCSEMVEGHLVTRAHMRKSGLDLLAVAGRGEAFLSWAAGVFDREHVFRPGDFRTSARVA